MKHHNPHEAELKIKFLNHLLQKGDINETVGLVSEFCIEQQSRRVDLLLISNKLHAIEIKSEADSLKRLEGQISTYRQYVDHVSIVAAACHIEDIQKIVPSDVSIWTWEGEKFKKIKRGRSTLIRDKTALISMLTVAELGSLLASEKNKCSQMNRKALEEKAFSLSLAQLRIAVREAIMQRYRQSNCLFWRDLGERVTFKDLYNLRRYDTYERIQRKKAEAEGIKQQWAALEKTFHQNEDIYLATLARKTDFLFGVTPPSIREHVKKKSSSPIIAAVDLFCGAGGLTHGLKQAGIHVRAGIDSDPACAYAYENNNDATFIKADIREVDASKIQQNFLDADITLLAGCAPCQPFSTYTREKNEGDEKWSLLHEFLRLVRETNPDIVTMENVPNLPKFDIFADFRDGLIELGYYIWFDVIKCEKYGMPQRRQRLVLLASKIGEIEIRKPLADENWGQTVRDAIGDMEKIEAGQTSKIDPLHRSSRLSPINYARIKASRPGGTWRDWDQNLVADCHKKGSGKTYPSVYGRMRWDEPSPTVTTQFFGFGNGRFGHPKADRALSLREGAILQTFPKDYRFTETEKQISMKTVGRLIGNAVPVKLGEVIGQSIVKHIQEHT